MDVTSTLALLDMCVLLLFLYVLLAISNGLRPTHGCWRPWLHFPRDSQRRAFRELEDKYNETRQALVKHELRVDISAERAILGNMMRTSELTERRMGQLAGAIAARDAECVTLRRQRQELTSSRHVQDAELKKLLTKRSLLENESRMLQEAVSSAEEEVARSKRQILMLGGECKELRESVLAQRATLAALAPHRHTTGFQYEVGGDTPVSSTGSSAE